MDIVVKVIAEHLLSNRRLVVPSFGAFMVKESGERVFSDLLCTDDGVLTSLLRNRGLNEMETAIMIDRFIFKLRHELEQYGYCRLGDIGTLRVEPTTKKLQLYPPVQGEMPKHTPYIPKQFSETENGKRETENKELVATPITVAPITVASNISNTHSVPKTSNTPNAPKKAPQPRKKLDFVMVAAIVIVFMALVAIGYGWYVSSLSDMSVADDAAMDALRVIPGQGINE